MSHLFIRISFKICYGISGPQISYWSMVHWSEVGWLVVFRKPKFWNICKDIEYVVQVASKLFDIAYTINVSSMIKRGGQLKTTKRENRDYMILEL